MTTSIQCRSLLTPTSKRGVILFVVMGAIFVLTILVMSYNHLVQGKFNESREILKHLKAMKTAQAVARFITCRLKSDLASSETQAGSPGEMLRKAFQQNDPAQLKAIVERDWLFKLVNDSNFSRLKLHLLGDRLSAEAVIDASFSFADITALSSLKEGNELFLDFEKAGIINLQVSVNIGKTREIWQEARPFRVVVPFPMPLTKFTMYLRSAADASDPMKYNTVKIDAPETCAIVPGSPKPLFLFNGMPGENNNMRDNVWEKRGWIYLGGGRVVLNRAGGHMRYGQGFHSYSPECDKPITLLHNFDDPVSGGTFKGAKVGSNNLTFSVAKWGFTDDILKGPFAHIWKKVLAGEIAAKDPVASPKYWNSSLLHLFGSYNKELVSMTRVVGDVEDRFLDMGYFADSVTRLPVGAVVSMSLGKYNATLKSNTGQTSNSTSQANIFIDELICFSGDFTQQFQPGEIYEMEDFFLSLKYDAPGYNIAYRKTMSKTAVCAYDETYDMIAQYSKNTQKLDIPPTEVAPKVSDLDFKLEIMGLDCKTLKIDKIADTADATLGMNKRVCYEITEKGAKAFKLLRDNFCLSTNSDFNLTNAVVRINTGGAGLEFADNLGAVTGGSILVDGPITLGTFKQAIEPDKVPLLIMAEKGAITVKNSTNPKNPTLAYLVALDKDKGAIKFASPNIPLNLLGGIAANNLIPDDISIGGRVTYNTRFDPTGSDFKQHVGVVIGPVGAPK